MPARANFHDYVENTATARKGVRLWPRNMTQRMSRMTNAKK